MHSMHTRLHCVVMQGKSVNSMGILGYQYMLICTLTFLPNVKHASFGQNVTSRSINPVATYLGTRCNTSFL